MTIAEVDRSARETLLRIHVITGWIMPADESMLILVDEFKKKIVESYPNVTHDEVCHAFRSTGYTAKEWGKALNISLIDEVMIPYLEKRFEVSKIEQQQKQIQHKPSPEELAQIDKEFEEFKNTDLGKRLLGD
jgi:hypothetical protein